MKHAAVLLIVGTLAGTPVADLICVSVCDARVATHSFGCHHTMAASASTVIKDADDTCARLFTSVPYLREEAQQSAAVMPASTPHAISVGVGAALLAATHRIDGAPPGAHAVLVLRV